MNKTRYNNIMPAYIPAFLGGAVGFLENIRTQMLSFPDACKQVIVPEKRRLAAELLHCWVKYLLVNCNPLNEVALQAG